MDRKRIEELYRRHGAVVHRRALMLLGDPAEANDVLQDVFITGLTKGDSFRGDSSPTTWLYAVTTNLCLNRLRNAKRRGVLLKEQTPALPQADQRSPELMHQVRELLAALPEELARVAVGYYLDGMSHQEIAEQLGCSRRQVGYLLDRLHARVREQEP